MCGALKSISLGREWFGEFWEGTGFWDGMIFSEIGNHSIMTEMGIPRKALP
jgi:hypothetical protein